MNTTRILTTLALAALMTAPGTMAIQGEGGVAIGGGGPYELDPWSKATAWCSEGHAFARAQAMGLMRYFDVSVWGTSGSAEYDDGPHGSMYGEETGRWTGEGSTGAYAIAQAGGTFDSRSCTYQKPGPVDWLLVEAVMVAKRNGDKVYPLPDLGCESSEGSSEHVFEGLLGVASSGQWVLGGLLDGVPAVLPAGVVSASTLPMDVDGVVLGDLPVSFSFKAGHCGIVVGDEI